MILSLKILYPVPAISEVQAAALLMSLHQKVLNSTVLSLQSQVLVVSEVQADGHLMLSLHWGLLNLMLNLTALNLMLLNKLI